MRVIRHSDDIGITRQSTAQALEVWRVGNLDGFSILVNGDGADQISYALTATPLPVRLAVHFNLTEGRSSATPADVPLLIRDDGSFRHSFGSLLSACLLATAPKRRELLRQIALECAAQIAAARSLCGARVLSAIDGHIHVHMIPGIFGVVARCARDAGISEIRISSEPFHIADPWRDLLRPIWWVNLVKHLLLRVLSLSARRIAREAGVKATGALVGVLYSGRMSAARALCGIGAAARAGAAQSEVVFHIGRTSVDETGRWRRPADIAFHLSELRDMEREELGRLSEYLRAQCLLKDRP